mmetsp:Transcript_31221/g.54236  ORF Transcript_31221/g.54236 Transcript_31221/m.54236 type:complete len:256 (+) Transcript_31221:535-1302(+)
MVCVWDTVQRTLSSIYYGAHTSAVSSVSFSPANHLLLCSVGLDQRISFFDSQMQHCVKTIEANAPLTAVAFNRDGANLAVGTLTGSILLYDLRVGSVPKAIYEGHEGHSINWLEFSKTKTKPRVEEPAAPQQKFKSIEEIREEAKARIEKRKQEVQIQEEVPPPKIDETVRTSTFSAPDRRMEMKQIRRVVQEAVMRYEGGLREDISCLHVELVRQLTQQSAEMQQQLEAAADEQAELLERLRCLQEECKRLSVS